jgi:hypothetical protein
VIRKVLHFRGGSRGITLTEFLSPNWDYVRVNLKEKSSDKVVIEIRGIEVEDIGQVQRRIGSAFKGLL